MDTLKSSGGHWSSSDLLMWNNYAVPLQRHSNILSFLNSSRTRSNTNANIFLKHGMRCHPDDKSFVIPYISSHSSPSNTKWLAHSENNDFLPRFPDAAASVEHPSSWQKGSRWASSETPPHPSQSLTEKFFHFYEQPLSPGFALSDKERFYTVTHVW